MSIKQVASFYLHETLCGIDVRCVREINRALQITPVDRAPEFISGLINLRGQIVTVLDIGRRMGIREKTDLKNLGHCIVLKTTEELSGRYLPEDGVEATSSEMVALGVDAIGDMVSFDQAEVEPVPANLGEAEGRFISGIVKLEKTILSLLKIEELLRSGDDALVEQS